MPEYTVLKLGTDDFEKIMSWRMEVIETVFAEEFSGPDAASLRKRMEKENRKYLETHLEEQTCLFFLVCLEESLLPVGCGCLCLYEEMPSPDNPNGRCGYLMNIYTRKQWRHQGAGEYMIESLIQEARKKHVDKLYLEASKMALPLYQKIGFTEMKNYLKFPMETSSF